MKNFLQNTLKAAVLVCVAIIATSAIDMGALAQTQDGGATPPAVNQLAHSIFKQLV